MVMRSLKIAIAGLLIGILGILAGLSPLGGDFGESFGLDLLFNLRGRREAPPDVVIVTLDRISVNTLSLLPEPRTWPRSLHAGLTENLSRMGAAVIVFDILFEEPRYSEEDAQFAQAISEAGNVVLCQSIRQENMSVTDLNGKSSGAVRLERLVPPANFLSGAPVAVAPFPLPKVPVKVSSYWTFKGVDGGTPTLPVVVFAVFTMEVYPDLLQLLKKVSPSDAGRLPQDGREVLESRGLERLVCELRSIIGSNGHIGDRMLDELRRSNSIAVEEKKRRLLTGLIRLYQQESALYLNFYGPPGTITTIPYVRMLQMPDSPDSHGIGEQVKGKAVFIGLSQLLRPEQRDGFNTVFSQPNGSDLSGVEIAATAFANLIEDLPVQPLSPSARMLLNFMWAGLLSFVCRMLGPVVSGLTLLGISTVYLWVAYSQFSSAGIWFPLFVPLVLQVPVAYSGTLLWKFCETQKEKRNIRRAFRYYLPENVVDELAKGMESLGTSSRIAYGTCLCTDGEQYVTLSERLGPKELKGLLNQYYEAVFVPVRDNGGVVSDVVGDSMLALWAEPQTDAGSRRHACLAALGVAKAVDSFNRSQKTWKLPTRIGLHSGEMALGNVGGIDHFEYRAVGDVVNTAARIEGLNKILGTQILASSEVMTGLEGFITRELGIFMLAGKSKPVAVHEVIGSREECLAECGEFLALFAEGLSAYRAGSWENALAAFRNCLKLRTQDGPSLFYVRLCEDYKACPPGEPWDCTVSVSK